MERNGRLCMGIYPGFPLAVDWRLLFEARHCSSAKPLQNFADPKWNVRLDVRGCILGRVRQVSHPSFRRPCGHPSGNICRFVPVFQSAAGGVIDLEAVLVTGVGESQPPKLFSADVCFRAHPSQSPQLGSNAQEQYGSDKLPLAFKLPNSIQKWSPPASWSCAGNNCARRRLEFAKKLPAEVRPKARICGCR